MPEKQFPPGQPAGQDKPNGSQTRRNIPESGSTVITGCRGGRAALAEGVLHYRLEFMAGLEIAVGVPIPAEEGRASVAVREVVQVENEVPELGRRVRGR